MFTPEIDNNADKALNLSPAFFLSIIGAQKAPTGLEGLDNSDDYPLSSLSTLGDIAVSSDTLSPAYREVWVVAQLFVGCADLKLVAI